MNLLYFNLIIFLYVLVLSLHVCLCIMHVHRVPAEAKRERQIPLLEYRWLYVAIWVMRTQGGFRMTWDWDPAVCPPQAHALVSASFPFCLISPHCSSAHKLKPACLVGLLTTSSSLKSTLSGESIQLTDHDIQSAIYPGLTSEGPVSSEQVSSPGR